MQDGQTLSEIHVWYLAKLRFVPNLGSGSLVVGESQVHLVVLGCHSKLRNGDIQSRQPLAVPAVQPVEDGIVCWVLKSWPIFEQKTPREVPVVAGLSTNGHIS